MCSCIPSKNHIKLVNNCYPTGHEEGPKQSELAYLSYYASSRPVKLLKVSAYLEKCLLRDLSKRRWSDVTIALKIFQQLTRECEKDLNLFAKSTIKVTEKCVLEDEVSWYAGAMFHDFCLHFDATTVGVDEDLTIHMDCLVTKFCEMACYLDDEKTKLNSNHRLLGLYGIYSMLISPLMKITHSKAYYTKLAHGILSNVSHPGAQQPNPGEDVNWESFKTSDSSEKYLESSQINLIALKCLQQLLESSAPLNIFLVVDSVFSYIEKHQLYENSRYSVDLASFMMSAVAPSYQHIIVNEVLRLLNDCPVGKVTRKQVTLVKVIEKGLGSSACVGISVLEYVSSMVGQLQAIYQNSETTAMTIEFSSLEVELKRGLISAISSLGTHLYYLEQINDILAFIINKLHSAESKTATSALPFELDLLKCMRALVEGSDDSKNEVPLPIITPTLSFLTNENSTVRYEYTRFLFKVLTPSQRHIPHAHARNISTSQADQVSNLNFRSALHKRLLAYGEREKLAMSDYNNIFLIFRKLIDRELTDELIRALPILFHLHRSGKDPVVVDQFLSQYLLHAGDVLKMDKLSEYARHSIQTREKSGSWIAEENPSDIKSSQTQYVSAKKVREILKREAKLQQHFPDINERLDMLCKTNSPNLLDLNYMVSLKSRLTSNAKQSKLSIPIIKTSDVKLSSQRKSPQVEQFKDALKVNNSNSVCEDDSDSSDLLTGSFTTVKKSKGSRTDITNLLSSISAHSLVSVTSLVETPYLTAPTSSVAT
ncbi:plasma membrane localization protein [Basidiobolus ranarum]|uniref:Plasma membrane localization protein n=1 Tax=Basidiobolus ranarum TaxID=34480 RepID=A0ABR2W4A9_9FUNG